MTPFLPGSDTPPAVLATLAAIPLAQLTIGYALSRQRFARHAAILRVAVWAALAAGVVAAQLLTLGDPPGFRMIALVVAGFAGAKTLVATESSIAGERLPFLRWIAFAWLWFGMRVSMVSGDRRPRDSAGRHLRLGATWITLGVASVLGAHQLWRSTGSPWAATPLIMVGFSFVFHFGGLNLCTGLWRAFGFDAYPLFRSPQKSQSLGEFWARRWNVGFSEMTAIAVSRRFGRPAAGTSARPALIRGAAILLGFLFSGALHEMAISLPVMSGWGLPTAYFLLHGVLVLAEEALRRAGRPLRGAVGRTWTFFWLIAPLPALFHPNFVREVLWPMAGITG
jgi:alginate O-acetyltransferase complex protein AlgI